MCCNTSSASKNANEHSLENDQDTGNTGKLSVSPNPSNGKIVLEWDGEKGLYRQHWAEYIDLLMADEVTVQLLLPIQKIIELKQNITTAVYLRHPDGSFRGLIKKLNFSVGIETGNLILCTAQIAKL